MRYFAFFILLSLTLLIPQSIVEACSSPGSYWIEEIPVMGDDVVIVHAVVVEVDERGYSAIIRVKNYLKGEGAEYLPVMRYPVSLTHSTAIRDYYTGCTYDGSGEEWQDGSEGYFALRPSPRIGGVYTGVIPTGTYGTYPTHWLIENNEIVFWQDGERSLNPQDFEVLLMELAGSAKITTPVPVHYPLKRFLNITTESGNRYILNPDRSISDIDIATYPMAISNDGSHVVFKHSENQLGFQYLSLTKNSEESDISQYGILLVQDGQNVVFSPDSNFVAVQELSALTVHMFTNYDAWMEMQTIASKDVTWTDDKPVMVWSQDSTTLAFQDAAGIWLWNIFEAAEPNLSIPRQETQQLIDLSLSGRYIRYEQSDIWYLLDTKTNAVYEWAIATPDERNLIFFHNEEQDLSDIPDINRLSRRVCTVPLSESCPLHISTQYPPRFFWYKYNQIAIINCYQSHSSERCELNSHPWVLSINHDNHYMDSDYRFGTEYSFVFTPYFEIYAYDAVYDSVALVTDDYQIELAFNTIWQHQEPHNYPPMDIVDLSDVLDSPVAAIEWGQPIFFERFP